MVIAACSASITFATVPIPLKVVIGVCGAVGIGVIVFVVPTIRDRL